MTPRTLTPRHRRLAEPFRAMIPDSHRRAFWRRVREGFYLPVGLFEGDALRGLLVASLDDREHGRDLFLQLATEPQWASQNRHELQDLVAQLSREHGATRVVFESKRRGWARVARSLGFTPEQVLRCTMEVPHGR